MARIVLVQPPHRDTFGYSMPPLGLLHVGAGARRRGHEVAVLDLALAARRGELPAGRDGAAAIEGAAERVLAGAPDAVGIGAMISSMPAALHLAAELKVRAPQVPIVLGGQGPESVEEAILGRYPAIDAVAVGESDFTLAEWLDHADEPRAWCTVPGLVIRGDGLPRRTDARSLLQDLDAVPPPDWSLVEPPRAYAAAAGASAAMFPIDIGRGCTYACTFCTTPTFWGRAARHLSPARAVDELDRLAALGDVECAYVTHDLFTSDRQRVLDICAEKLRRGNALPWECRTRIDLVDPELLDAMAAAGCRRILFGVESDSAAVLERVRKGGRRVDHRAALAMTAAAGIAPIVGVMAGVPGETRPDLESNLQLLADAALLEGASLSLHWMNVTPGNGREEEVGPLALRLPLTADLVRGFDVPPGAMAAAQRRLVEHDPEVFAAFRVADGDVLDARRAYLLTRNAHVILEAMPRTARALSLARRSDAALLDALLEFLEGAALAAGDAWPPEAWDEPWVLRRDVAVRLFAAWARAQGREELATLADYEEALATVRGPRLLRLRRDPADLLAAVAAGRWPPRRRAGDHAVLFTRRGERARAHSLSPFLADVAEGHDDDELARRWPGADAGLLARARSRLSELARTADGAAPPEPAG